MTGAQCSGCIRKAKIQGAEAGGHQFSNGDRYPHDSDRAVYRGAAADLCSSGGLHCWAKVVPGNLCLTRKDDPMVKAKCTFCSMIQVLCDFEKAMSASNHKYL